MQAAWKVVWFSGLGLAAIVAALTATLVLRRTGGTNRAPFAPPTTSFGGGNRTSTSSQEQEDNVAQLAEDDGAATLKSGSADLDLDKEMTFQQTQLNPCDFRLEHSETCLSDGVVIAPLSLISKCLSIFRLDKSNALQFLESLYDMTNEYYVFQDIAVNARESDPNTTPFDYAIYSSPQSGGQVNVLDDLRGLIQQVQVEGAAFNMFFQVNAIYGRLRDKEVVMNQGVSVDLLRDMKVFLTAQEVVTGTARSVNYRVENGDDEFNLVAEIVSADSTFATKVIKSIDGVDPLEWFTELALQPLGDLTNYKSIGPRVQSLLKAFFYDQPGVLDVSVGNTILMSDPSTFFKDRYSLVYEDDSVSSWRFSQTLPCTVLNTSAADIQLAANRPGEDYERILIATTLATQTSDENEPIVPFSSAASDSLGRVVPQQLRQNDGFVTVVTGKLGYRLVPADDYAIFKVASFDVTPEQLFEAWAALTDAATPENASPSTAINRLIVDVIDNTGEGLVSSAYFLASLLYPNVDDWQSLSSNPYDRLFASTYDYYIREVSPVFGYFNEEATNSTFLALSQAFLNADPVLLAAKLSKAVQIFEAMSVLTPSQTTIQGLEVMRLLNETVAARAPAQIAYLEVFLLLQQILNVENDPSLNFATQFFAGFDYNLQPDPAQARRTPVERNRGGLSGNYTVPSYASTPNDFTRFQTMARTIPSPFTEYLILGNGLGGANTNTFVTTVAFHAKAFPDTAIPLGTVSFGGNGDKRDCPVTQYAGGSVQDVELDSTYVPLANLYLVNELFGAAVPSLAGTLLGFDAVIPPPCYYCDSLPTLTLWQVYSSLGGGDGASGIPLEYVDVPPDYYMPRWYFRTDFDNGADLEQLYQETAAFFEQMTVLPTTLAPTTSGTKTPVTSRPTLFPRPTSMPSISPSTAPSRFPSTAPSSGGSSGGMGGKGNPSKKGGQGVSSKSSLKGSNQKGSSSSSKELKGEYDRHHTGTTAYRGGHHHQHHSHHSSSSPPSTAFD